MGKSLAASTGRMVALGLGVSTAAVAVLKFAQALSAGVKAAVAFDREMTKIETLVGVNRAEVSAWREDLEGMARALGKSPQELSEALFFITSAGLRGSEALNLLEISAKASAIGLGETKVVADAATSALNAYGIENLSAEEAVRVLLGTVREGKAEADAIAGSLGRVIPIASQLGVRFQDLGSFIAATTRVGLSAEEGVTGLRAALNALISPTPTQTKALDALGLSLEGIRKKIREEGLAQAFIELTSATGGNAEALREIIPEARALTGILAAYGEQAEATLGIQERMREDLGEFGDAWERVGETTAQQWSIIREEFNSGGKTIGDAVASMLSSLVRFDNWSKEVSENNRQRWRDLFDEFFSGSEEMEQRIFDLEKAALAALPEMMFEDTGAAKVAEELGKAEGAWQSLGDVVSIEGRAAAVVAKELAAAQAGAADRAKELKKAQEEAAKAAEEHAEKLAEGRARMEEFRATSLHVFDMFKPQEMGQIVASQETLNIAIAAGTTEIQKMGAENIPMLESFGPVIGGIEEANTDWNDVLSETRGLFTLLGGEADSVFGRILGWASKLFDAFNSLTGVLGAFGVQLKGLGSGPGGFSLGNLFGGSGEGGEGGAGFSLSGLFGNPVAIAGIAIAAGGILISALGNVFGGRDAQTVMEEAGRDMGVSLSEGLAKQINESGKNIQLMLPEIFAEGNLGLDRLAEETGDIFSGIEQGLFSTQEASEALARTVPILIENFDSLGTEGMAQVQRIIEAAKRLGIEFEGLDELTALFGNGMRLSADDAIQAFLDMGGAADAWSAHLQKSATDAARALRFLGNIGLDVPQAQHGGFVPATPGGTLVNVGEGGQGEFIVPASKMGAGGMGGVNLSVTVNAPPGTDVPGLIRAIEANTDNLATRAARKLRQMGEIA
jgi:TP901 family phage tail tape measure protein